MPGVSRRDRRYAELISDVLSRLARLRQSFWFAPALLCVLTVVLAEALIFLDQRLDDVELGAFAVLITRVGE